MQTRVRAVVDQAQFLAQTAALDLQRAPDAAAFAEAIRRWQADAASRLPGGLVRGRPGRPVRAATARVARSSGPAVPDPLAAGPWAHLDPPATLPSWVTCAGHAGLIAYTEEDVANGAAESGDANGDSAGPTRLAVRAVALPDSAMPQYAVVVDVPVTAALVHQLRDDTGIELGPITALTSRRRAPAARATASRVTTGRTRLRLQSDFAPAAAARMGHLPRLPRLGHRAGRARSPARSPRASRGSTTGFRRRRSRPSAPSASARCCWRCSPSSADCSSSSRSSLSGWGWRSRARSPGRSTSSSRAPSGSGKGTSRTRFRSARTISSATSPTRSIR